MVEYAAPEYRRCTVPDVGTCSSAEGGVTEEFQGPLVGREQGLLLNLALAEGTGSHSLAPHLVTLEVHSPLPPGQPTARKERTRRGPLSS